ncbi:MAG: hypothetical protein HY018_12715 [Hydrogenophilales bacterium]|nr:hypothetical protein [Hydrogenophilales bacterium]
MDINLNIGKPKLLPTADLFCCSQQPWGNGLLLSKAARGSKCGAVNGGVGMAALLVKDANQDSAVRAEKTVGDSATLPVPSQELRVLHFDLQRAMRIGNVRRAMLATKLAIASSRTIVTRNIGKLDNYADVSAMASPFEPMHVLLTHDA